MRSPSLRLAAPVVSLLFALGCGGGGSPPAPGGSGGDDRPNILFILSDDQRPDALGAYGNESLRTPNLDRLAAEGARLDGFYVASPLCASSRAALLTARYGHQTNVLSNQALGPFRAPPDLDIFRYPTADLAPDTRTVAHALEEVGYVTGFVGKAHLGGDPRRWGFSETPVWLRQASTTHFDPDLRYSGARPPGEHVTEIFANAAIDFVERHQDERWFLWLATTAPHTPYLVTPRHEYRRENIAPPPLWPPGQPLTDVDWAGYYATISLLDEQVGRVLDRLRETGQLDRTFVAFISDNGHMQARFQYRGALSDKTVWYEESARVPAVIRSPAHVRPATVIGAPVVSVDLTATFLDLAGAGPLPGADEATSLLPALRGDTPPRQAAFAEAWAAFENYWRWQLVRTERYKYVRFDTGGELLYDLATDPYETRSIADEPGMSQVLAEHRARREAWLEATPP